MNVDTIRTLTRHEYNPWTRIATPRYGVGRMIRQVVRVSDPKIQQIEKPLEMFLAGLGM